MGLGPNDDEAEELHRLENQVDDSDDYDEPRKKLDTVREGNETNPQTTDDKRLKSSSGGGLAGLRDINELGDKSDGSDEEYEF